MSVKFNPQPQRILVRGVNWLGDAVMTSPALLRLREKFPNAHITILTPQKISELWKNHPAIDEVISFSADENIFTVGKKLRAGKYDGALVLPNSPRSALEIFLAGIPQRIGYSRPWRNFFLTQAIAPRAEAVKMHKRSDSEIRSLVSEKAAAKNPRSEVQKTSHQIFEYLNLVAQLSASSEPLAPKLFVATEEIEAAKTKFGLDKIPQPVLGLNPGAEYGSAKRWPVEKFISAAKEIQAKTNCLWILFGGKSDVSITNQIESALGNSSAINLAGKTSLRELMSLLKGCRVLLTNDTGPMHVAAALGVPVVAIFGSTSPELTGPVFSPNAKILKADVQCAPCFLRECPIDFRCMESLAADEVAQTVRKMF
jgi:heptosyltransferase II